jgi:hypothetical protein
VSAAVSSRCPEPQGRFPRVTHPCAAQGRNPALDLHVLGAPPAFVLSQDQTLSFIPAPAGKKKVNANPPDPARKPNPTGRQRPTIPMPQTTATPPPAHPLTTTNDENEHTDLTKGHSSHASRLARTRTTRHRCHRQKRGGGKLLVSARPPGKRFFVCRPRISDRAPTC